MIHRFEFFLENPFPWGEKLQESYEFSKRCIFKASAVYGSPVSTQCVTVRPCKGCWVTEQLIWVMTLTMLDMVRHIYLVGSGKVCTRQKKPKSAHLILSFVKRLEVLLPCPGLDFSPFQLLPSAFSIPSGFRDSLLFLIYTPAWREALKD